MKKLRIVLAMLFLIGIQQTLYSKTYVSYSDPITIGGLLYVIGHQWETSDWVIYAPRKVNSKPNKAVVGPSTGSYNHRYWAYVAGPAFIDYLGNYVIPETINDGEMDIKVTSIGSGAFKNCIWAKEVYMPHITYIEESAFENCPDLSKVTINYNLNKIGKKAFADCTDLTTVESIDNGEIVTTSRASNEYNSSRMRIQIPYFESAVQIGDSAFAGCTKLTTEQIMIKDVQIIGSSAFRDCKGLKTVKIPSLSSLGEKAYSGCTSLKDVYTSHPKSISDDVFSEETYEKAILHVPAGQKAYYKNLGGWKNFQNIMEIGENNILVTGITLNASAKELSEGQTFQLTATVSPSNATNKNVAWSSSNTAVATVNSSGLVTAVAPGTAVITCTAQDGSGVKATCSVTVKAATVAVTNVTNITLNATSQEITQGQTFQLSATVSPSNATNKNVAWSSSNTAVATVSSSGLVTAVAPGTAVITCTAQDGSGVKATCSISVLASATPTLSIEDFTISAGEEAEMLIDLNNPNDQIMGVQFDLRLPDGLSVLSEDDEYYVFIAGRTTSSKHYLYATPKSDGTVTVYMIPTGTTPISGTSGAIISIELMASATFKGGDIRLENIGLATPEGVQFSIDDYVYTLGGQPQDDNLVTPPAGLKTETYYVTATYNQWTGEEWEPLDFGGDVQIGIDGSDVYLQGLCPYLDEGWVKGTISDGKVVFPTGQLWGYDDGDEIYLVGQDRSNGAIIDVVFNYNSETDEYTLPGSLLILDSADKTDNCYGFYSDILLSKGFRSLYVEAGTLADYITADDKYSYYGLKLYGELNGTDFRLLRDMAGNNYLGETTNGQLSVLDMSNATVVKGGERYLDTNELVNLGGNFRYTVEEDDVMPKYVFCWCRKLVNVSLPVVTKICEYAFEYCKQMKTVDIPDGVEEIEVAFFCTGLTSVFIPASVKTIGSNAFGACDDLMSVIADENSTYFTSQNGVLFDKDMKTLVLYPGGKKDKQYTVPNSVETIGRCALYFNQLEQVTLPVGLKVIEDQAFRGSQLLTLELPSTITSIGNRAFMYCSKIGTVTSHITNPTDLNEAYSPTFDVYDTATLYVPAGTKAKYQARTGWKEFKTIIEMEEELPGDVNLDGQVGIGDIVAVTNVMAGNGGIVTKEQADVNGDGDVGIGDIVAITNIMAGGGSTSEAGTGETKTYTVNGVSFTMIGVDGGTFQMGGTDGFSDERPVHSVTLSSFSIGQTEVTQQLWYAVMGQKPTADGSQWSTTYGLGDQYPAYYVSWDDCQEFITKLNQLTGQQFRLPTEAEWEFAARGGNSSKGYTYAGSNTIGDVAWYRDNIPTQSNGAAGQGTQPIATKQANELGIYDMSGNVLEWCQDWYSGNYYSSSPSNNPAGPDTGSYRVRRGGCWSYSAMLCRVAFRNDYQSPTYRSYVLGFRLAL